jgi:hypothetical protein
MKAPRFSVDGNGHLPAEAAQGPAETVLETATRLATRLAELLAGAGPDFHGFSFCIRSGGVRVVIKTSAGQPAIAPRVTIGNPTDTGKFSEIEAAIIQVLSQHDVLSGPKIAPLAGYPYDTILRTHLASMRRRGLLINECPGHRLAKQP